MSIMMYLAELFNYMKKTAGKRFSCAYSSAGYIAEALDEATGLVNQRVTPGSILTIRGNGLKIESDIGLELQAGVFFKSSTGRIVKAETIAVNDSSTLKVFVPDCLIPGIDYQLAIATMSSIEGNGKRLKRIRKLHLNSRLVA